MTTMRIIIIRVITPPPLPLDVLGSSLRTGSQRGRKKIRRASRSHSFRSRSHDTPTRSPNFFRPRWEPVRRLIGILKACHI